MAALQDGARRVPGRWRLSQVPRINTALLPASDCSPAQGHPAGAAREEPTCQEVVAQANACEAVNMEMVLLGLESRWEALNRLCVSLGVRTHLHRAVAEIPSALRGSSSPSAVAVVTEQTLITSHKE